MATRERVLEAAEVAGQQQVERARRVGGLMRRRRIVVIALAALVFLAISIELARWLSVENDERDAILTLLSAQARGDAHAMLAQLHGCGGQCRADAIADARRLERRGAVLILADQSQTAYSLTGTVGDTRIAWKVAGRLPVVQCIKVSRTGNVFSGLTVRLLSVSLPIPGTADC